MRFMLGLISDEEATGVERHLSDCGRCVATASGLAAEDAYVAAMRAQRRDGCEPAGPEIAAIMERLHALHRAVTPGLTERNDPARADTGSKLKASEPSHIRTPVHEGYRARELKSLGDYRIVREIGRGGMGVVYEAEQESLGRRVALKVLAISAVLDAQHLQRFGREARAAARLHHTNIVPVFGIGQQDGLHYYVMQFIEGQGLDTVLVELRRLRQIQDDVGGMTREADVIAADASRVHGRVDDVADVPAAQVAESLLSGQFAAAAFAPFLTDGSSEIPSPEPSSPAVRRSLSGRPVCPTRPAPMDQRDDASHSRLSGSSSSVVLPGQPGGAAPSQSVRDYWHSVARIGVQVSDALTYAASQGVLHRDVKPSNLLLDTHGTIWVTDFGLAKASDSEDLTHTGDIVGTLRYMAPERFNGQSDIRSDIYSLGLTLYELLTFRPAFHESERHRLVQQVTSQEPVRPRKLNPAVPRDLETIVLKAIAREPARRYQTGRELAEDLQRFLDDRPIRARPMSHVGNLARWCRRNPALAILTGTVAVAVVTGTFVASYFAIQAERKAAEAARYAESAQIEQRRSEHRLYVSEINLAHHTWKDGQTGLVLRRLDELRPKADAPDLRGFEWYFVQRLCRLDLATWSAHAASVTAVAFSPDGRFLATASEDHTVKLWNTATGVEQLTLQGHTDKVWCVTFSPEGDRLASCGEDHRIKLWNLRTGSELLSLDGHDGIRDVAFSPDGRHLVSAGCDERARVWDVETGHESMDLTGHTNWVVGVAYSPDGRRIASGGVDRTVKVWDAASGQEIFTLKGHTGYAWKVSFSPDGRWLASAGWDQMIKVWDMDSGREAFTLRGHSNFVADLAFSPDGGRLASASWDNTVKVWDLVTQRELLTLRGHTKVVESVAFSPDGRCLASAGGDQTIKIWDASSDHAALVLRDHMPRVTAVAFSPHGARLASAGDDCLVRLWDSVTGDSVMTCRGHTEAVACLAFSPDGQHLASAGYEQLIKIWDTATGREVRTLRGHTGSVRCVAFSPDSRWLAAGEEGETPVVRVWDTANGRETMTLRGHTSAVWGVAYSPDGRYIASGSNDTTAKLWDAVTGQELLTLRGHTMYVAGVAFSPDSSRLATAGWDRTVRLWDTATGQVLGSFGGHSSWVQSVAFSPDGRRLVSCGADGTWKLWDSSTFQLVLSVPAHAAEVVSVAFSPDGLRLATGGWDNSVRIWDATPLTPEVLQQRHARSVMQFLLDQGLSGPDVFAHLQADVSISEPARQRALVQARASQEQ